MLLHCGFTAINSQFHRLPHPLLEGDLNRNRNLCIQSLKLKANLLKANNSLKVMAFRAEGRISILYIALPHTDHTLKVMGLSESGGCSLSGLTTVLV
jgi:hypothetical protein